MVDTEKGGKADGGGYPRGQASPGAHMATCKHKSTNSFSKALKSYGLIFFGGGGGSNLTLKKCPMVAYKIKSAFISSR